VTVEITEWMWQVHERLMRESAKEFGGSPISVWEEVRRVGKLVDSEFPNLPDDEKARLTWEHIVDGFPAR
jgi:hypothetical protein